MSTSTDSNRLIVLVAFALLALVFLPTLVVGVGMMGSGGAMGGGMMGPMFGGFGDATVPGWMAAVALVSQVVFLALVVGLGYLLYRAVAGEGRDPALTELRSAYARGDLSEEEFERRRETLTRER